MKCRCACDSSWVMFEAYCDYQGGYMKKKACQIMGLIIGVFLIVVGIFYFIYVAPAFEQQKIVRNMQIKEVDL